MVKERPRPARAMYLLIAAALAISLVIVAAPPGGVSAQDDDVAAEWTMVDTPTMEGWVLAPESTIIDYALADGGEVAYAVINAYDEECVDGLINFGSLQDRLLKSDDYGATWDDLTEALEDIIDVDGGDYIDEIRRVATDGVDPDFVAVALRWYDSSAVTYFKHVFFSTDGGDTFIDGGGTSIPFFPTNLAVSPEAAGKREIALGGSLPGALSLFRFTITGDSASAWEDATLYDGWDDDGDFYSRSITDIVFSPSWATDKTILATTVWHIMPLGPDVVYLQCGSWGNSEGWNEWSTLGIKAVQVIDDVDLISTSESRFRAGMTLPEDYNSKNPDDRVLWVWVNYYDETSGDPMCQITRVEDDSADPVGPLGQIENGELFLTNISYQGTIAEGKAIAGVLGDGLDGFADCCEGVQVYRNDGIRNMDICCERWHDACKPPTGTNAMKVAYIDDDKAYAVALQGDLPFDEDAWSVTFDDGDTWNQLSLIDTWIDYLSDVAVSPDCNKTMLVSVFEDWDGPCDCDSVWLHAVNLPEAEEYSGKWLRTWCGPLDYWGLLRLPPSDAETTGDTVVLVDWGTNNVYLNEMEGLACWDPIGSTELDEIMDLAMQDTETLFALEQEGDVAMFDGDEWQEAVDSEVSDGVTVAVWGDHILVGGEGGEVSYSDDGGETFELLEDTPSIEGHVTVAFDSYFDQNSVVYAATDHNTYPTSGGIYMWIIGESEEWTDLGARNYVAYTGLVVDTADGNPWTSPETGGVLYASYIYGYSVMGTYYETGVARTLQPIVEICCDVGDTEWDYLVESDPEERLYGWNDDYVDFEAVPDALKICGCLTPDSNTHLFALDNGWDYDICEGEDGTVWTFEDCYAKKGVELVSPGDGFVVGASACECNNVPFTIRWDRLCDACCYEIQFALDEDFEELFEPYFDGIDSVEVKDMLYSWYCPIAPMTPSAWIGSYFLPETTYYWRIRAVEAETDQAIKSWWSEPMSFTVAPTASEGAINLVSPEAGATGVATTNLGFSWLIAADVDSFDWVLDNNSDFSSPLDSRTGLTDTAYGTTQTLSYDTTYYWQVTAYKDGSEISKSAVGTFRTMMEADEPPLVETPPTPFWVWVVIAIGAVLVIVVIVLIFRTRRV